MMYIHRIRMNIPVQNIFDIKDQMKHDYTLLNLSSSSLLFKSSRDFNRRPSNCRTRRPVSSDTVSALIRQTKGNLYLTLLYENQNIPGKFYIKEAFSTNTFFKRNTGKNIIGKKTKPIFQNKLIDHLFYFFKKIKNKKLLIVKAQKEINSLLLNKYLDDIKNYNVKVKCQNIRSFN